MPENITPRTITGRLFNTGSTAGEFWFQGLGSPIVIKQGTTTFGGLGSTLFTGTPSAVVSFSFYRITAYINISAFTSGTALIRYSYTDENSTAQTNITITSGGAVGTFSASVAFRANNGQGISCTAPAPGGTLTAKGIAIMEMIG